MEQERQKHLKSVKPGGPTQHRALLQVLFVLFGVLQLADSPNK